MAQLWNSAVGLLLVTGGLLGLILPFGKIATDVGVSPVLWAFVVSAGTGAILLASLFLRGRTVPIGPRYLRYYFVTGLVSFALPNLLLFYVIPHLGSGYSGIMFTISPIITLLVTTMLGIQRLNRLGMAGIAVGFVGAFVVALTRGEIGAPAGIFYLLFAMLIPFSLATGNIYRTMDWPPGAGTVELAAGSHLAAAAILFAGAIGDGSLPDFSVLAEIPVIVFLQVVASALMFVFFFRLQQVGGPVYLSQIGYVAAVVGLAAAVIFLGERYSLTTFAGALVIVAGIAMTTIAQSRQTSG